jgi:hypothetical protein
LAVRSILSTSATSTRQKLRARRLNSTRCCSSPRMTHRTSQASRMPAGSIDSRSSRSPSRNGLDTAHPTWNCDAKAPPLPWTRCGRCMRAAGVLRICSSSSAPMRLRKLRPGVIFPRCSTSRSSPSSRGPVSDSRKHWRARRISRHACAFPRAVHGTTIYVLEARTRDVSSTAIRARLAQRKAIDDLVPAAVARHIIAHHLYGAVNDLHGQNEGSSNEGNREGG